MAVSSYIISEIFPNKTAAKLSADKSKSPISYATIYNPLIPVKENALYIVMDPNEFPENDNTNKSTFIVIGEPVNSKLDSTVHDVICLPSSSEIGKIYEAIVELLEKYNSWETELSGILLNNGSAEEICCAGIKMLKNPIVAVSPDFKIISVGESAYNPFTEKISDERGYLKEHRIVNMMNGKEIPVSDENTHFCISSYKNISTLIMTSENKGQTNVYICMDDAARPITDGDITRLNIFSKFLKKSLEHSLDADILSGHILKNHLHNFLFDNEIDQNGLLSRMRAVGWDRNDTYFCCVLQIKAHEKQCYILNYICGYIEHHMSGVSAIREKNRIYILCNLTRSKANKEHRLSELDKIADNFKVPIGISSEFHDSYYIKEFFMQANAILNFFGKRSGIFEFNDYRLEYLLKKGFSDLPLIALLTPKLYSFMMTDKNTDFENYRILRAYIRNNLNISDTIAELYLHRSSFIYRLDKIKKMLGTDFADKNELLYYQMIFYAADEYFHIDPDACKSSERNVS